MEKFLFYLNCRIRGIAGAYLKFEFCGARALPGAEQKQAYLPAPDNINSRYSVSLILWPISIGTLCDNGTPYNILTNAKKIEHFIIILAPAQVI